MNIFYVIQDINCQGFWDSKNRKFRGWLYTEKFSNYEETVEMIKKDNVGVCKITKIFDSK